MPQTKIDFEEGDISDLDSVAGNLSVSYDAAIIGQAGLRASIDETGEEFGVKAFVNDNPAELGSSFHFRLNSEDIPEGEYISFYALTPSGQSGGLPDVADLVDYFMVSASTVFTDLAKSDPAEDGELVAAVAGTEGSDLYATAEDTTRPTYRAGYFGDVDALEFDGFNDLLRTATLGLTAPYTVYLVVEALGVGSKAVIMDALTDNYAKLYNNSLYNVATLDFYGGTALTGLPLPARCLRGELLIIRIHHNGASSEVSINGTPYTGDPTNQNPDGFVIGGQLSAGEQQFSKLMFFEMAIYDYVVASEDDSDILAYMTAKYASFTSDPVPEAVIEVLYYEEASEDQDLVFNYPTGYKSIAIIASLKSSLVGNYGSNRWKNTLTEINDDTVVSNYYTLDRWTSGNTSGVSQHVYSYLSTSSGSNTWPTDWGSDAHQAWLIDPETLGPHPVFHSFGLHMVDTYMLEIFRAMRWNNSGLNALSKITYRSQVSGAWIRVLGVRQKP